MPFWIVQYRCNKVRDDRETCIRETNQPLHRCNHEMLSTQWALDARASFDFENWNHDSLERLAKRAIRLHRPTSWSYVTQLWTDLQVIHATTRFVFFLTSFRYQVFLIRFRFNSVLCSVGLVLPECNLRLLSLYQSIINVSTKKKSGRFSRGFL